MTERTGASQGTVHRFWLLLTALLALLIGYPYFADSGAGAFLGGITSLLAVTAAVYALRTKRWTLLVALALAIVAAAANVRAFMGGVRGDPIVEAAFTAFYAFTTVAVFLEVIKARQVESDTLSGAVCVYLLVGLAFANLYDLIETLHPGSFQINVDTAGGAAIGWRTLVFFSFMTLTTIGLGDVTPTTPQTQ
jgi:hypothetical protein